MSNDQTTKDIQRADGEYTVFYYGEFIGFAGNYAEALALRSKHAVNEADHGRMPSAPATVTTVEAELMARQAHEMNVDGILAEYLSTLTDAGMTYLAQCIVITRGTEGETLPLEEARRRLVALRDSYLAELESSKLGILARPVLVAFYTREFRKIAIYCGPYLLEYCNTWLEVEKFYRRIGYAGRQGVNHGTQKGA
jgi:hypothetical protein